MNRRSVLKKHNNKKTILKILCIAAIIIIGFSRFILHSHKQYVDTSGDWRLILVDKNHYIPKDYQMNLTRLSNGKQVDSRIYPSSKSYITGISNEPWHYRYVGKEAAATIKKQNLCLEEYLKKYK